MNATSHEPLNLSSEELELLAELMESGRVRLLVEIRHTHHRTYREELRRKLDMLESLEKRILPA